MRFASFERNLQHAVSEAIAVQAGDGHGCLVVVGHSDEAEAFALVRVEVADHLNVCHRAERPEHLPQDALVCVRSQVVDEDAPACARVAGDVDAQAGDTVDGHGWKPTAEEITAWVRTHADIWTSFSKELNNEADQEVCSR